MNNVIKCNLKVKKKIDYIILLNINGYFRIKKKIN